MIDKRMSGILINEVKVLFGRCKLETSRILEVEK